MNSTRPSSTLPHPRAPHPVHAIESAKIPPDRDLVALRQVLLAPEQMQLREILRRLDDPATRAAEIAAILPATLALAAAEGDSLIETLRPLIREALADTLKARPDPRAPAFV